MAFKVVFHTHSNRSDRGNWNTSCHRATPDRLVENAFRAGLDAIAVTDTNNEDFFNELGQERGLLFKNPYQVTMLPGDNVARINSHDRVLYFLKGIEMHDKEGGMGHLSVIGYRGSLTGVFERLSLKERIRLGKSRQGIVIGNHPFSSLAVGISERDLKESSDDLDAVERFNAQLRLFERSSSLRMLWNSMVHGNAPNRRIKEMLARLKEEGVYIPTIASPDSNSAEVGLAYVDFMTPPTTVQRKTGNGIIDYLRDELAKQRSYLHGTRSVPAYHTYESLVSQWTFLRDYGWECALKPKIFGNSIKN